MRKIIFCFTLPLLINTLSAQVSDYCIPDRFGEEQYFSTSDITVINEISYGMADYWYDGNFDPQLNTFDIAFPKIAVDDLSKRPFIGLFHGGGFAGGDKTKLTNFMMEMAKRGYVVATFNYRLGWDTGGALPAYCLGDPESLLGAYYRSSQDVDAGMRFVVSHAAEYGIDTNMLFMGGQSAGVICVYTNVFMTQQNINQKYPMLADIYGDLNASTNDINATYSVKGIINMWGAILDTTFITANENIPVISFYGLRDSIVPPFSGPIQNCTSPNTYFTVYGSESIYSRLSHLGICTVLHKNIFSGHEAYDDDFTITQSACFLKRILCNNCYSGKYENEMSSCEIQLPIFDNNNTQNIKVYPNPTSQNLFIDLGENNSNYHGQILIFDGIGREVPVNFTSGGTLISINVSNLPNGMYYGQILGGEKPQEFKFVVNHN